MLQHHKPLTQIQLLPDKHNRFCKADTHIIHCVSKKRLTLWLSIPSSNIDWF